ncbi:PREDICTED: lipoma HMGIC fusion partner-like 2 protein [Nicrophorus vespilloides]|uniref:Lipoma HMGIC fusion partner-like 2 protein n=1 Tax=Nicrophorus vespilloides TaxID=110193 RepID=A0ABM1M1R4_NICVS|nr:PREDICTED: lipoma HMGIC fusion partner-like 2 protein [Nicrophorus vespilloides]XP_017768514.1 PREDICTED: lipoma HMGIC fusion partner-like 2 protein [Nicrophorus vespilloides]
MVYVIVTGRSLLWVLMSLVSTVLMLVAFASPVWLVGMPKSISYGNETRLYNPSIGVYSRCKEPSRDGSNCNTLAVRGLLTDPEVFPDAWKAACVFLGTGLAIMTFTVFCSVAGCCYQSICKKSIFTVAGSAQVVAGMFYILVLFLFPMAWSSRRVQALCGREVSHFYPADCSFGLGMWIAIVGTALTFCTAYISIYADKATSSDHVQDQISDGRTLICLP